MTSGQSIGRVDPKLGQHHARRLVDLRTAMHRVIQPHPITGIGTHAQEHQCGHVRSTHHIP